MFTLVPSSFFNPAAAREALAEVVVLKGSDIVRHIEIPQYGAVLIYASDGDSSVSGQPEIYGILQDLQKCPEYNKILCSIKDGRLYIAIAQGKTLLLANSYSADSFTTAEYYIFLAMKSLQLNPEVSTICWISDIDADDTMSLYRYFKTVERI